ncbi:MAG TPA: leucine--tRNA ligase [Acidimicrobiia bacterium]|mgnify:CR=1 FL=1|nr:leucine--tRNA ligase [Acidimicrobiia bacterium]
MSDAPTAFSTPHEFPFRYDARLANEIELKWQDVWEKEKTYYTPNPTGPMAENFDVSKEKLYVLDMFPYPSGAGLHVGHPLGYIATDVYARFKRMTGYNVLHAFGYDAFGLPAEQYAVQTGTHPRITTEKNISIIQAQLRRLGMGHDERRGVSTIDPDYYKWTQWIFLTIYNSYFDDEQNKARPIEDLISEFELGKRTLEGGQAWSALTAGEKSDIVDNYRLAYLADSVVNWCPGLGTVLANEEVTADGKSERGNFDVFRRPMKQWMMRITKYADRLLDDLEGLDWTDAIKTMQRHWIGKSRGASVSFDVAGHAGPPIEVFTTRPDTLFGASYLVLAPEHPLVDEIISESYLEDVPSTWRTINGTIADTPGEAVAVYRAVVERKSERDRQSDAKEKTGVFTGAYAINPINGESVPIFIADYVLSGYGTGAIMAVPAHDQRDFEFASVFGLPKPIVVEPSKSWCKENNAKPDDVTTWPVSFNGEEMAQCINSTNESISINGMVKQAAIDAVCDWLDERGAGESTITYRLRDWLFSRQRYWGEPFPIVFDEEGRAHALPISMLPVTLPELDNFAPESSDDPNAEPKPPLGRATDWVTVDLDLGDGVKTYRRETNTMPNWAGSCWYYLRYLDPFNDEAMIDPDVENYWAGTQGKPGIVDLYVGGAEHAVLHLLYARFWHKVLFDRGYVSTKEPFQRLINQGYIQAFAYKDERGFYVEARDVKEEGGKFFYEGKEVTQEYGKIGKSLKNMISPDDMCQEYGADTLRMYEMFMGPLEMSRPWSTADVAGVYRFIQRMWRGIVDEETGKARVSDDAPSEDLARVLHKTIDAVRNDYDQLSFNTAIAKMFELNNEVTKYIGTGKECPREVAEALVLMVAPLAPHVAQELWSILGNEESLVYEDFPQADAKYLVEETIEIPVQILGKVKARINVAPDASADDIEAAARADESVQALLEGKKVVKVIAVPGRMINFVVA